MLRKDEYWCSDPDAEAVVGKLKGRRENGLTTNPMYDLWERSYNTYYANAFNGDNNSGLNFSGARGELVSNSVNETRSLIRQFVSLITKVKLSFEPLLSTSDTGAIADARVGKALCEWICLEKALDTKGDKFAECAAVTGSAFMGVLWRPDLGDDYSSDGQNIVKTGDVDIFNLQLSDVTFDYWGTSFDELDHLEFRVRRNRYSVASMYPDLREVFTVAEARCGDAIRETDNIWVYYWFHKPTPILPKGRMIVSLEDGTVLVDDVNYYECIPVISCIPETFQNGLIYGYPKILDLIPMQESMDTVFSAITTNLMNLGLQMVCAPDGNGLGVKDVGGMQFLTYTPIQAVNGGMPQGLNLVQNAPDAYKFVDSCRGYMTELSGLNGALRGTPPPGVTSGVALATLSANALEFLQAFSKSWQTAMQNVVSVAVRTYAIFAKAERQIPIAGKNNQAIVRTFIGDDLRNVKQVKFAVSNPQQLTVGGRIALAESLLSNGLVKDANQYLELIFSGSIEGVVEGPLDMLHLIRSENDDLSIGTPCRALSLDTHAQHILHHVQLLSDPDLRRRQAEKDPAAVKICENVLSHILEHKALLDSTDPTLLAIVETGQAPAPQPQAQQPPQLPAGPAQPQMPQIGGQ